MSRAADLYYSFRFIKLLTQPWDKTDAFAEGILDNKGKLLIKVKNFTTSEQKNAYTMFHRLVYNIKRVFERVPFGSSRIKSYAAALFLIREETGMAEEDIIATLDKLGIDTSLELNEDTTNLSKGEYILNIHLTEKFKKGSVIKLAADPIGLFNGITIYKSEEGLYFTEENVN